MFKEIVQTTANVLRLAQDVQQNREEIKELRTEFRDVVTAVEGLKVRMEQVGEREERARQMIVLQLENMLLRREVMALPETAGAGEG
ncbi:MAG TPA: hypothetical protein VLK84_19085 [Longimicrobium sp.]|nr:hypothetical protein [Longimicrobium sp.]